MASRLLYVGSYTRPAPYLAATNGRGISVLVHDDETGALDGPTLVQTVDNPSYLRVAPDGATLHAVWEVLDWPAGLISSYRIDPATGGLTHLRQQDTRGTLACYVDLDAAHRTAYVANYLSGDVAVFPVDETGAVRESTGAVHHRGSGPDAERQDGPHAHCAVLAPDEAWVFSADLGIDAVVGHVAGARGGLAEHSRCDLPAGFGPRHLVFHPSGRWAYVVGELASAVVSLAYDSAAGTLTPTGTTGALPPGWTGASHAADVHVHPSGRWVYSSNRGHDSIAVFTVDPDIGTLRPTGHRATEGATPRNFALSPDGRHLVVANQDSDTVVVLALDDHTGMPTEVLARAAVPTPACVCFGPPRVTRPKGTP